MQEITTNAVRYIKLGAGGIWTEPSFQRGELHFGFREIPHGVCEKGDWETVIELLGHMGRSAAKSTDNCREIRDFYTSGADTLWITFADGHLWWAFAEPEVTWLGPGEKPWCPGSSHDRRMAQH